MIHWFSLRPVGYPHRGMAQVGNGERMQMDGWAGWNAWEGRTLQLHVSCISTYFTCDRFATHTDSWVHFDVVCLGFNGFGRRLARRTVTLFPGEVWWENPSFSAVFVGVQETFGIHQGLQRQRGCGEYGRLQAKQANFETYRNEMRHFVAKIRWSFELMFRVH